MAKQSDEQREYRHWDAQVRKGIKKVEALERRRKQLLAQRDAVNAALVANRESIAAAVREIESAEYERESVGAYLTSEV